MKVKLLQFSTLIITSMITMISNPIYTKEIQILESIEYEENVSEIDPISEEIINVEDIPDKEIVKDTQDQIDEEVRLGEMEVLALLIHAEAGNQDLKGKRLVADVVLNRVDDGWADGTIEGVVFQFLGSTPQFSTITDGAYDNAGYEITEEDFEAAKIEYEAKERLDNNIFYFRSDRYSDYGIPAYKYGGHYFNYK